LDETTDDVGSHGEISMLSTFIESQKESESDFLLPVPNDNDDYGIRINIYLFGT